MQFAMCGLAFIKWTERKRYLGVMVPDPASKVLSLKRF